MKLQVVVDVETAMTPLRVGYDGTITLTLAAPSGVSLSIEQGLPAGASVDEAALRSLGLLTSHQVRGDRVLLTTRAFNAGEVMEIPLNVRPAFAGTFTTPPLRVGARSGSTIELPPLSWRVAE